MLGELQFAFVCFLIGNVYEAFEHWKQLLLLLCRSEEAMRERSNLYLGLISVLYHQLGEIPPDFFVDIVSQNNFLTSTLQVRRGDVRCAITKLKLVVRLNRLDN